MHRSLNSFAAVVLAFASAAASAKEVPQFLSEPLTPAKRDLYYKILDRELALAIQQTWQAMLARNPVPDPDAERYISVDGYSAEFSVRMPDGKKMLRDTSNAHGPPATHFVEVALMLAEYCRAPEKQQAN